MKNPKNVFAVITDQGVDLSKSANSVNNGRTDGSCFYVSGNEISFFNPHYEISIEEKKSNIAWFIGKYREFEFKYEY